MYPSVNVLSLILKISFIISSSIIFIIIISRSSSIFFFKLTFHIFFCQLKNLCTRGYQNLCLRMFAANEKVFKLFF